MNVRLVQIDGALPNLALMKMAHWHRSLGDTVLVTRDIQPTLFEPRWDRVYASSIFSTLPASIERRKALARQWPHAIVGGTGTEARVTVEDLIGREYEFYDYSGYPEFDASIGFTQRGCRLSCKFCVVPKKEGKPRSVNTIYDIWRGEPWPRKLHILDNDFFGQSGWRDRIREIQEGGFKVCLSQGINIRMIDEESAAALASIEYRDTKFRERRLYTAWDNLGDESAFFAGVEKLQRAGIPPTHLMVFMLVGYAKNETWKDIWYRFRKMVDLGIAPFPMVYDRARKDLLCFQRYVNTGLYRIISWLEYDRETKTQESIDGWTDVYREGLL